MLRSICIAVFAILGAVAAPAQPVTNAFTYQGELRDGGAPANGAYDMRFRLFAGPSGGTQVGEQLCADDVPVSDGRFTLHLEFGLPIDNQTFDGNQRFLEIEVRSGAGGDCASSAGFVILGPRQPLTATPYASYAQQAVVANAAINASQLGGLNPSFYRNAGNMDAGTLPGARLGGTYSSALTLSNPANSLNGNGAGLTALNASNVTTGVLAIARGGIGLSTPGANGTFLRSDGSGLFYGGLQAADLPTIAMGGDLTGTTGNAQLALGSVGSAEIADGSVTSADIALDTITAADIATGAVGSAEIADNSIAAADLAPNAVTNVALASDGASLVKVTGGAMNVASGNIGVGTPAGSDRLLVAGNATVTGNLDAATVSINAASRVLSLGAHDFVNSDLVLYGLNLSDPYLFGGLSGGSGCAPVHLPQGAVITSMVLYAQDAAAADATAFLIRREIDGVAGGTMAQVATSGNVAGIRTFTDSTISGPTILNDTYVYFVRLDIDGSSTGLMQVRGVRINYTVTQPLP